MQTGVVKWYDHNKRFGFILPDSGGPDIFVHVSGFERSGLSTLQEGQRVGYEMGENRGRSCAVDVRVI